MNFRLPALVQKIRKKTPHVDIITGTQPEDILIRQNLEQGGKTVELKGGHFLC